MRHGCGAGLEALKTVRWNRQVAYSEPVSFALVLALCSLVLE